MIVEISCAGCGSKNLEEFDGDKTLYFKDFYCLDCDEDLELSEVDWKIVKEGE